RSRPPASATWTSPWPGCTGWTRATWRRWRGSIGGFGGIPTEKRVRVGETLPFPPCRPGVRRRPRPAARVRELRGELRAGTFAVRQPLRDLRPPACPGAGDEPGRCFAAARGRAAARRAVVSLAP